jgi:molybdenum cofactor biosynthesis protein B
MSHIEHREQSPAAVRCAVLTISDTRTEATDTGGAAIVSLLEAAGHVVIGKTIVRDEAADVRFWIERHVAANDARILITTGGTGISARDGTFEVASAIIEKPLPGFGELFRMLSYRTIGTSTIQSRATAGVARGTYIFALPGSTGAVVDGWDGILRDQLDIRHKPCNFVELMPRLLER